MARGIFRISRIMFLMVVSALMASPAAWAQDHIYTHYDAKDGLAGSTVYSMVQDQQGFIWFGTEAGLSRFDGTHFTNFTTAEGLPDNEVLRLFADSRDRIWIVPFRNALAYYWKGKIYTAKNDSLLARLNIKNEVHQVIEDSMGNILVYERFIVHIVTPAGKISTVTELRGRRFDAFAFGVNKDNTFRGLVHNLSNNVHDTLFYVDIREGKFRLVRFIPRDANHVNGPNFCIIRPELEVSRLDMKLDFFFPLQQSRFSIPVPTGFISLCNVNDSNVAINSINGAYLVDIFRKKITDTFLKGQTVNWTMEDTEGNLWVSTLGKGVFRLGSREFRNYSIKVGGNSLPVFSVRKIDSNLYIGGDHLFLSKFTSIDKNILDYETSKGESWGRVVTVVKSPHIPFKVVGTDNGIFFAEKGLNGKSILLSVKSISQQNDSVLMVFSAQGVCTVSAKDLQLIESISVARSTCGYLQQGIVYIGALDGLYMTDSSRKMTFLGEKNELLKSRISGIEGGEDGTIWIATYGQGLIGYRQGKVIAHITQSDGLTSNICRDLFISGKNAWVGTDKGLNKIVLSGNTHTIIPYTSGDGLSSDIINSIYVEGSQVYVGTPAGLTSFDESKVAKRSECRLHFTTIRAGDQRWGFDTTDFAVPVVDKSLQFEFVGISFKSTGNISYQFRLTGLDNEWHTTRQTFLNYPSLPYGNYDLEMYAVNKFGLHSETRHIRFSVERSFMEKTWVRICFVTLVAGLVWLLFTFRLRRLRRKETEKAQTTAKIADLEQMALRSQMNPHFIFNCLNSIQEYVIDKDIRTANEFITRFSYLIRQTLDISSRPLINLNEEINYISTYIELEIKRFGNKFVSSIIVSEEIDRQNYHIPPMILQPYIENAIRHGIGHRQDKKGRITITMRCSGDRFLCCIEDNGVGRRMAHQYKSMNAINYQSMGMTLVAKRINMLNKTNKSKILIDIGDLEDGTGKPSGTRITLDFPLDHVIKLTL